MVSKLILKSTNLLSTDQQISINTQTTQIGDKFLESTTHLAHSIKFKNNFNL